MSLDRDRSFGIVRKREKQEMQRRVFSPRSNFLKKMRVGGGVARARIFYERSRLQWKFLLFVRWALYRNIGISKLSVKTNDQKEGNDGKRKRKLRLSLLPREKRFHLRPG